MDDLLPKNDWPAVEGMDVVQLLSQFGLRLTGPVDRLPGGLDNVNLRATTDQGVIVIRRYESSNLGRAQMELDFASYLARRGFPTPEPMPAINGSLLVEDGGRPVALFSFVAGVTPESSSEYLATQIGGLLAQMHLLGQDWRGRLPVIDRLEVLDHIANQSSNLLGWEQWLGIVSDFLAQHGTALESVQSILPKGPIHHDAHRANVIVQDGAIVSLLDLGEINVAPFVIDVLRLCHYLALEADGYRLPKDLAAAALVGYRAVRELTDAERHALNSLFGLVNLSDAADFLSNPPQGVSSVYECRSLQVYIANSEVRFNDIL